ncbi:AMP-binding protein [bacterium]|nr:AMP-binding protein [bacterium]
MLKSTGANQIVGVPSLMRKIAEHALENGEDPAQAGMRRLIAIGEPTRDASLDLLPSARLIEEAWGAPLYSTYASTEIATTFCECPERRGGHLRPELLVVEIVNDEGRPVPAGETGEVVVTPLGVRGMPLVRFRTGDVSFLMTERCSCGRFSPRLGPILGRKNQMLKFKGTTVFPNAIVAALEGRADVAGACVEVGKSDDGTDRVVVYVHVKDPSVDRRNLEDLLRSRLRVVPEIVLVSEAEINDQMYRPGRRKRVTFLDRRGE